MTFVISLSRDQCRVLILSMHRLVRIAAAAAHPGVVSLGQDNPRSSREIPSQ